MPGWTDPVWLGEAHEWIRAQLVHVGARALGEIEQRSVQPWSTVLVLPTDLGDVYFKAAADTQRHEAALVAALAERRPDCIPRLLACDADRGWLLMEDAGTQLRLLIEREQTLARWLDVLPLYAGVQLDLAPTAEDLIQLGVPDLRLATLPARYEQLLDELDHLPPDELARLVDGVQVVEDMCLELAAFGLPESIQHDDLDDEQIYARDGGYRVLDWGDACISHPFFTLSVTLEGVIAWGLDDVRGSVDIAPFRDAYLAPFARHLDAADLVTASTIALRLGWVCRAVNGHRKRGTVGRDVEHTRTRLRLFLDGPGARGD